MIVLIIVSVLVALALPGLSGFSSKKDLWAQADELTGLIAQVRMNAMNDGTTWRIVFSPPQRTYVGFCDANGNMQPDPGEQSIGPVSLRRGLWFGSLAPLGPNNTKIPDDGISFVNEKVSFSPLGTCNAGTIYLCSERESLALRVLPASGTIQRYSFEEEWRNQ
ncbi:MAG: GspH/FimT family protein [Desulfomonilia bacterium]|nr:GspH/FimT family protein [Desulfomonilia bacterium]